MKDPSMKLHVCIHSPDFGITSSTSSGNIGAGARSRGQGLMGT